MINNLGVFLNNTDSEIKIKINKNNYLQLKKNFNKIIITDIENIFSERLKQELYENELNNNLEHDNKNEKISNNKDLENNNEKETENNNEKETENNNEKETENNEEEIENNKEEIKNNKVDNQKKNKTIEKKNTIINYILDNNYLRSHLNDLDSNIIENILNSINFTDYDYITFINDNYIYCSNLKDYFAYFEKHNLEFSSYTDSTENEYHYQLYLFSIKSNTDSIFKFINLINKCNKNELLFKIPKIFNTKMPFLKIAYLKNNMDKNIFHNTNIYKDYVLNNYLPIININYILNIKNNFKFIIFDKIPSNFDYEVYKKNKDLNNYSNKELEKHFLEYGQFEFRPYTNMFFILPIFIRKLLKEINLIQYFDVPDNFDIFMYREKNDDLKGLTMKELLVHWVNYGRDESRIYFK